MCNDDQEYHAENSTHARGLAQGWVIEGCRRDDGQRTGRYLQIGTGQWCPSQYATVFPLKQTAMVYAHEFGYSVGQNAHIVRYFRDE